jgi:signal peptidase II
MNSRFVASLIGTFVFFADVLSKYLTHTHLPLMRYPYLWYPYGGIPVFKDFLGIEFSISHQINHGAAWGVLSEYQMPLLYLRIGLIAVLLLYFLFFNKHTSWYIPLALILAGAIGNVLDYFIYGHVVDMLHAVLWGYDFPVFNIADSAICIGVAWIFAASLWDKKTVRKS